MIWKVVLIGLALANGGWMLFDGTNVLRKGKYFGPEIPGPWRHFPEAVGIDPFAMGPVFILLGLGWTAAAGFVLISPQVAFWLLAAASISSLWFISIGTAISLAVLLIILIARPFYEQR